LKTHIGNDQRKERIRMSPVPSIDYTCSRCGAVTTYHLDPAAARERQGRPSGPARAIPSIDYTCSRCGANDTYTLTPDFARKKTA
jgi:DNA-directed RNA polymerase subunit RPC12/RpoP